jgi:hypothetical protein
LLQHALGVFNTLIDIVQLGLHAASGVRQTVRIAFASARTKCHLESNARDL